jgi:hypothetical protein
VSVARAALPRNAPLQSESARDQEITRLRQKLAGTETDLPGLKAAGHTGDPREDIPVFFVVSTPKSDTTG